VQITNEFTVGVPIERAWAVLTDLEGIAPCMPGAQLTGRDGDTYRGKVKIKVGPVTSEYAGTAAFTQKDDTAHRAVIDAKGRDSRGAGNASALISASLHAEGERTRVSVETDLKITGKIAQFGSGMINEVSQKLLGQFVARLEAKLAEADQPPTSDQPETSSPEPPGQPEQLEQLEQLEQPETSETSEQPSSPVPGRPTAPAATRSAAVFAATPEPEAIDLMSVSRGALLKRLAPLVVGAFAILALVLRRARRRR
jgi:carbon monoxide dehydrogenase subunit G